MFAKIGGLSNHMSARRSIQVHRDICNVEGVKRNEKIFKKIYKVCYVEGVEGSVHMHE